MDLELPELPFSLRSHGPDGEWSYADGVLTGQAGARQDRFVPPGGDGLESVSDAPRLLGRPDGDFQLIARITVEFAARFDAGVLYLHVDDQNWAKFCFEYSPDVPTVCTVVTRGHSDDTNSFTVDGNLIWFRISRIGRAFAFHASHDGDRWIFVRHFTLGSEREARAAEVGFLVQSPEGEGCRVSFDRIGFKVGGPEDLRDGS
ncbi:DUF1349 domain-containing protein [Microlunatus speluncae]|uniref:DUF1349 domain-containing protein n=1 Tax=Microlunatus speluncae TaxID=2594267 RepID=UPI0012667259|nr:DUF1349 domain-containing protein [Microlunatus speluncae]